MSTRASSRTGCPPVPDFHGGDTNFKSIDYLSIPLPVMQTLNALVIDGVLQRHPDLRIGVIELGAIVDTELDADARLRARGVPQERGAAAEHGDATERVRAAARCARRRIRTRTRAGRSRTPGPRCACSRRTSRTSRAAATRSGASSAAWTRPGSTATHPGASTGDNFVDLLGPVLGGAGSRSESDCYVDVDGGGASFAPNFFNGVTLIVPPNRAHHRSLPSSPTSTAPDDDAIEPGSTPRPLILALPCATSSVGFMIGP